jgi:glucokinase
MTARRMRWALADLGATNARFALLDADGTTIGKPVALRCADYRTADAMIAAGLAVLPARADALALAAAGPVANGRVRLTNRPWTIATVSLVRRHRLRRAILVNDFAAVASSIDALGPRDVLPIRRGTADRTASRLVLGPGSGLGLAALVPDPTGGAAIVVPCEGGHALAGMPPGLPMPVRALWAKKTPCWEDLVSGPGIVRLYRALGGGPGRIDGTTVAAKAREGDRWAHTALVAFARLLGAACGDVALIHGARGGILLAGGILPALGDLFDRTAFDRGFLEKGEFADYLEPVPVRLVRHKAPALVGLARIVGRG